MKGVIQMAVPAAAIEKRLQLLFKLQALDKKSAKCSDFARYIERQKFRTIRRMQFCDTAGCKPALRRMDLCRRV
jgi:hypothetical protein